MAGVLAIKLLKKAVDIMVCKLKPSMALPIDIVISSFPRPERELPTVVAGMTGLLDVPI